MNEELFAELIASVKEGGAILRGEKEPARIFRLDSPDNNAVEVDSPKPTANY